MQTKRSHFENELKNWVRNFEIASALQMIGEKFLMNVERPPFAILTEYSKFDRISLLKINKWLAVLSSSKIVIFWRTHSVSYFVLTIIPKNVWCTNGDQRIANSLECKSANKIVYMKWTILLFSFQLSIRFSLLRFSLVLNFMNPVLVLPHYSHWVILNLFQVDNCVRFSPEKKAKRAIINVQISLKIFNNRKDCAQ